MQFAPQLNSAQLKLLKSMIASAECNSPQLMNCSLKACLARLVLSSPKIKKFAVAYSKEGAEVDGFLSDSHDKRQIRFCDIFAMCAVILECAQRENMEKKLRDDVICVHAEINTCSRKKSHERIWLKLKDLSEQLTYCKKVSARL